VDLAIFFRNFFVTGFCHVGLGVNARQTEHVLKREGYSVGIYGVPGPNDILKTMQGLTDVPTHVVIEAIWVEIPTLKTLLAAFPNTKFVVRCHSQVGFLQVEPPAVKILREMITLQRHVPNFQVCANNKRLRHFLDEVYPAHVLFLPNLYDLSQTHKHTRDPRTLRIASFGALRLLKNHMTAAAAALLVAKQEGIDQNGGTLEFWINVNRQENAGAQGILTAIRNLYADIPWATLVEHPWEDWDAFRRTMKKIDLYLQASYTETFNITVADAIASGIPAVVSDAIDWAPAGWAAEADSAQDMAKVGVELLRSHRAPVEGLNALRQHVQDGIRTWKKWLD
jgi:glycosyltransferase involved in cell wall biosynthesis